MSAIAPSVPATVDTADAAAISGKGRLCGIAICPTGAVTPTITIYDSASAAGTVLFGPHKIPSATCVAVNFGDAGINFKTGVFVHADSWTTVSVNVYTKAP